MFPVTVVWHGDQWHELAGIGSAAEGGFYWGTEIVGMATLKKSMPRRKI